MGNFHYLCQSSQFQQESVLSHQLKLYKWRSNPDNNTFISRTQFKNAYYHKQQQQFINFIQQQNDHEYLDIFKFRSIDTKQERNHKEEIIIFQKYTYTLKQLTTKLYIQEALYVLHSLLFGFQQIRNQYQSVVVEPQCCFITAKGEIRAWINPNCKLNRLWTSNHENIVTQTKVKDILLKIIQIVQKIALKHVKLEELFHILRMNIFKPSFKGYSFQNFRKIINQFCYFSNINMANNLSNTLIRLKNPQQNLIKPHNNTLSHSHSNNFLQRPSFKDKCQSTVQSQHKCFLKRSKSININPIDLLKNPDELNQTSTINRFQLTIPNKSNKNICRNSKLIFHSNIIQHNIDQTNNFYSRNNTTNNNSLKSFNQSKKPQYQSTFKKSNIKLQSIAQIQNNSKNFVKKISFGNNLTDLNIKQIEKHNTQSAKVNNQVFSLKKINQLDKKVFTIPKMTANMISHNYHQSQSQSNQSNQDNDAYSDQRAWITAKTITRLISSKSDHQLQSSIAQSDQFYNDSEYSGVLTNMGRSIVEIDPKRTKTVRVSRFLKF